MTSQRSTIDKWLIRGKDVILIVGAVYTLFIFTDRYVKLPAEVEAQAHTNDVQTEKITEIQTDLKEFKIQVSLLSEATKALATEVREVNIYLRDKGVSHEKNLPVTS